MPAAAMVSRRLRIDGVAAATELFAHGFKGMAEESVCVAHLDHERRLIDVRTHGSRHRHAVALPLRAIVRDALLLDAASLIVSHNHPSGDPAPSRRDLISTRALASLVRPLNIRLLDHLIFADGGFRSMCAMGLL